MASTTPTTEEIAGIGNGRDITRGLYTGPMQPEDSIVNTKGAGDYQVYEEMLRDDQIHSTLQQRRMALTSREWIVDAASSSAQDKAAADFIAEQLQNIQWDSITEKMHYGVYYGFAVGEAMYARDGRFVVLDASRQGIKVRKTRRFRFDSDGTLLLLTSEKPQGDRMPERKFWTYNAGGDNSDNPYGMGLAYNLYWPAFFKRNDIKFWLMFLEKFGMPTTKATYPGGWDNAKKKELLAALRSIQTDSAFIVPDGTAVELFEAARSGTADYAGLHSKMDAAIAKVVLSQVMTSEAVGGQYKADVQKSVRDEVVKGDSDLINRSFVESIVRWLTEWNFPGAGIPKVWRKIENDPDLKATAEVDEKIYALGYEPTEERIREVYGEGYVKKQAPEPTPIQATDVPPAFAESPEATLRRILHRKDQQDLADAARAIAADYEAIVGPRLDELLGYLEETGDLVTFRARLNDLLAQPPSEQQVERVRNPSIVARVLGALRAQR